MVATLYADNENAFYIKSSYATFSTVWTYRADKIKIYYLAKGRVVDEITHETRSYLDEVSAVNTFEFDSCMQLDSEVIGYKVVFDDKVYEKRFPVDIACIRQQNYESSFFQKLVKDISKYQIWETQSN
ncbi:MAG: hypothetical protein ACFB0B_07370 [Thermonemataceae bacterium]